MTEKQGMFMKNMDIFLYLQIPAKKRLFGGEKDEGKTNVEI